MSEASSSSDILDWVSVSSMLTVTGPGLLPHTFTRSLEAVFSEDVLFGPGLTLVGLVGSEAILNFSLSSRLSLAVAAATWPEGFSFKSGNGLNFFLFLLFITHALAL